MTPQVAGSVRTAATLGVLALLLLFAVTRGLSAVSEPFPANEEAPICVDSTVGRGDVLRAPGVTVSVINAGTKSGLAGTTLDDLEAQGFPGGELSNQREPGVVTAQVWSPEGRTPAVRLVLSYLSGKVRVVERDSGIPGITVVVGDRFPGVRDGRLQVKVGKESTVCGPAELG